MPSRVRQAGFNLMEVMIALLLLGLVIAISVETSAGDIAIYQRAADNTFARWVALNQIATLQLESANTFPALGKKSGEAAMGKSKWKWEQEILKSGNDDLRRIQVTVFAPNKPDEVAAMQVGYIANPNPKPARLEAQP